MELRTLEGKKVRVINMDGAEFVGTVGDYVYADDQPPEIGAVESIILDISGEKHPIEFLKTDIKSVEIIE